MNDPYFRDKARLDRIEEKIDNLTHAINALSRDGIPSREEPLSALEGGEGWIHTIGIGVGNLDKR